MTFEPNDRPVSPDPDPAAGASASQAQRDQLLKKLNCLIAVLEAAITKVKRSITAGNSDPDRLERIRANLENTLAICQRAKQTLERRGTLPANLPPEVSEAVQGDAAPAPKIATPARRRRDHEMTYRDYVELSSYEEFRKFRDLPPISVSEILSCDLDGLAEQLGEEE
ncbi:MAG TPA: hypothetical protein VKE69_04845 [Planctomycetota bacterium]|nr:hypothetical protein [Planctomycetota bacterium]